MTKKAATTSSKKPPLISVIIPVYNTANTLARCVESVRSSTYTNLEIILVDDGSKDGGGELCDKLTKSDSRIKVVHQSNAGLSTARNHGLKVMRGKFVTFIDSDDTMQPEMINYLYHAITTANRQIHSKTKISICSFYRVYPDGRRDNFLPKHLQSFPLAQLPRIDLNNDCAMSAKNIASPPLLLFDTATCLTAMLSEDGFTMSAWGKLYSSDLFQDIRFPEGKLYEDVGTTYKLILQCPKIAFVPVALYDYYQNPDSIIHQSFNYSKLDLTQLTDQMCDQIESSFSPHLPPRPLYDAVRCRRMHARFSILRQMVLVGDSTSSISKKQFQQTQSEIINYLKAHQNDILKNPAATLRDRLAMYSLKLGLPIFKLAWKIYSKRTGS